MKLKLKQLATVQMGYSFRSRLEISGNGETGVIQMKDLLSDNTISCKELARIEMKSVKDHHLVQKEDLVFRSRGQAANTAILLEDPGKAVVAAPLLRIRVIDLNKILPKYLNWYISRRDAQVFLTSRAKGTAQKMITKQTVEDMEICLPTLETQRRITDLADLSEREHELLGILAEKRHHYISTLLMQAAKGA
jgi:restriction endonuclease S subunit